MKRSPKHVVALAALLLPLGCATRQQTGALAGAGAGALAGGAITDSSVGAAVGGVLGALVGSEVGRYMDEQDRRQAMLALETVPTYETRQWVNPDTGAAYSVTPVETYQVEGGQPCREFRMEAQVGNNWEELYGTACRQQDGSWQIVDTRGL